MRIQAGLIGFQKLEKKLGEIGAAFDRAANQATIESTLLIHETAVKSLQSNSDGDAQTRYNPKREVHASKPGETPNTDTGRLAQSIQFEFEEKTGKKTGIVGTNLKYGAYLEFGTEDMEPRPWLAPAVSAAAKEVGEIFEKTLSREVKDLSK